MNIPTSAALTGTDYVMYRDVGQRIAGLVGSR